MGRPLKEGLALVDARRRREDRKHQKAAAIRRAVADHLDEGHSMASAARARGVPEARVRAEVARQRAAKPLPPSAT